MTAFTIRPYQPDDIAECRMLWSELTQHHRDIYDDPNIGGDTPGQFFDAHLARVGPEHIWVAQQDGHVIGLVGLIVEEQEAELEPLIVLPHHRHKGVGRALARHTIATAQQMGLRYLSVRPVARNEDSIAFFYEAGFQILGHLEMFADMRSNKESAWRRGPELFGHSFDY